MALRIRNLGSGWRSLVIYLLYALDRMLCWPHSGSACGEEEKKLPVPEIEPRFPGLRTMIKVKNTLETLTEMESNIKLDLIEI